MIKNSLFKLAAFLAVSDHLICELPPQTGTTASCHDVMEFARHERLVGLHETPSEKELLRLQLTPEDVAITPNYFAMISHEVEGSHGEQLHGNCEVIRNRGRGTMEE
jgi:hypothetical protein